MSINQENEESSGILPTIIEGGIAVTPKRITVRKRLSTWLAEPPTDTKGLIINFWMTIFTGLMFFLTLVIAAVSGWQAIIANKQYEAAKDALQAAKDSVTVAEKQWQVAKDALNDARESGKETSKQNAIMVEANQKLANAAQLQAEGIMKYVEVSKSTANAAEKSAKIAQDAFVLGERPFVTLVNVDNEKLEEGKPLKVTVKFVNTGKTPAINVSSITVLRISSQDLPENPDYPIPIMQSRSIISPSGVLEANPNPNNSIIPSREIPLINEQKRWIYVFGKVEYDDLLKQHHFTKFCGRYNPKSGLFEDCPTHNSFN
jgi:hypothetical protein